MNNFENGLGDAILALTGAEAGNAEIVPSTIYSGKINNQALAVNAGDVQGSVVSVVMPIPVIEDGTQATVFYRLALDPNGSDFSGSLALSPLETFGGWGDANVLFNPSTGAGFVARNGTSYETVAESRTHLVWYNVWYTINTEADTYSVYLQGGEYAEQTLIAEDFGFRKNVTGEDIKSFVAFFSSSTSNAEDPGLNGIAYVDDLYVDTAGINMENPAEAALFAIRDMWFVPVSTDPVVDGVRDSVYPRNHRFAIDTLNEGEVDGPGDCSGTVMGVHTEDGLYLFFEILDDVVSSDSPDAIWKDDLLQVWIDPDRSAEGGGWKRDQDLVIGVHSLGDGTAFLDATPGEGMDFSNLQMGYVENAGVGRNIELFIPWEAMNINPRPTWAIGFATQLNDDDDGGERDAVVTNGVSNGFRTNTFMNALLWKDLETYVLETSDAIVIDGVRESAYNGLEYEVSRYIEPYPTTEGTARFKMLYDAEAIYFHIEVDDESVIAGESENQWNDDGIEIVFDGDYNRAGRFDGVDDLKITLRLNDLEGGLDVWTVNNGPPPPPDTDFSGLESAYVVTETGWSLEVKVPFTTLRFTPEPGKRFGFDVQVNDDDDGGDRDGQFTWSSGRGVNHATDKIGTAILWAPLETTVAGTDDTIIIDGEIDDAYALSEWNALTKYDYTTQNIGAWWTAVFDALNLYLIVDVTDDDLSLDSPDQDWNDDSVEIFFDPSNDGDGTNGRFDRVEDFKITVVPVLGESSPAMLMRLQPDGMDLSGVVSAWKRTELGYRIEFKIPLSKLGLSTASGTQFGFDLQINDDDRDEDGVGGERDQFITWSNILAPNTHTYGFGTVTLIEAPIQNFPWSGVSSGEVVVSEDFGEFEMSVDGWLLHSEMLWLYVEAVSSSHSMWIYSHYLNSWIWTNMDFFPVVYNASTGSWIYYFSVPEVGVWVFDYSSGAWVLNP